MMFFEHLISLKLSSLSDKGNLNFVIPSNYLQELLSKEGVPK